MSTVQFAADSDVGKFHYQTVYYIVADSGAAAGDDHSKENLQVQTVVPPNDYIFCPYSQL